jgi:MFS family permease
MSSSLNPVNSSLIATALVPIAAAMHVSVGRAAVLVSTLYLASSIVQPTAGSCRKSLGRVFLAGIVTVLAGGLSPDPRTPVPLVARAVLVSRAFPVHLSALSAQTVAPSPSVITEIL